ncbi:MAG: transporter substrate-binding domain-containing protein [Pseudomonadota bacterium]
MILIANISRWFRETLVRRGEVDRPIGITAEGGSMSVETSGRGAGEGVRQWAAACAMACLFLWLPWPAFGGETVHLAAFEYSPFYYEQDGEVQGIAVELTNALFGRMGMGVGFTMYPLKRALHNLEVGSKDGIMILIKTPERQAYIEFSDPVMQVRGLIWSSVDRLDGPIVFERFTDLRAYKIGVTRGYSYGTGLDELLKEMAVNVANSDLSNFRMLVSHRIDVFPCNEVVAGGLFKQYPELAGKVVPSDTSFIEWELHMGISKKSPLIRRMREINAAIAALKEEGMIDAIVNKYVH